MFALYLNACFIVIPNIPVKFNIFDYIEHFLDISDLLSPQACRMVSGKTSIINPCHLITFFFFQT